MATDRYPKLCGGAFFTLILQAIKQKSNSRQHYAGVRDGLSNPEVLKALIRVAQPDFEPYDESFEQNASSYKNCKKAKGEYLPFDKVRFISLFDDCVKSDYTKVLDRMSSFVDRFIDTSPTTQNGIWLVRALIDVICIDKSILDSDLFYCCESGQTLTKIELSKVSEFCLPAFLLGIWHFIIMNRKDNKHGEAILDISTIGNSITRKIMVTLLSQVDNYESNSNDYANDESINTAEEQTAEQDEPFTHEETADTGAKTTSQNINNATIFNQYGNNNTQIGTITTLTINND